MAVYTEKRTYHTRAHMGMIDVTEDFQQAVTEALNGMKRIVPLTRVRSKRALPLLALRLTPFYQAYAGVFLTPVPAAGYGESVHQLREMLDQAVAPTVVQILEFFRGLSTHLPLDSRLNLTFGGTEDA